VRALPALFLLAALGALAAAPACAQDGAGEALPLDVFAYDRAAPLDVREGPARTHDGVRVRAVSFASPGGGRATGMLFVPDRGGRFAGIVLQHGMPSSAADMGRHGVYLALKGAVVLALDAPFARRGGPPLRFTPADSAEQVQLVVDLQRAVDLLVERRDVDPARLAYVGRSYGGAMGALFAGVERRLKTYVLMVGDGGLVAHLGGPDGSGPPRLAPERRERWLAAMRPIEPSRFVHRAPPASILFQSGRRDPVVPVQDAEAVHRAARQPSTVRWYDAGHDLTPQAYVDQLEWLHRAVGTGRPGPGDRQLPDGPLPLTAAGVFP
jgi:dienelactone hydrolase